MPLHVATSLQMTEELLSGFRDDTLEEVREEIREMLRQQALRAIERENEGDR